MGRQPTCQCPMCGHTDDADQFNLRFPMPEVFASDAVPEDEIHLVGGKQRVVLKIKGERPAPLPPREVKPPKMDEEAICANCKSWEPVSQGSMMGICSTEYAWPEGTTEEKLYNDHCYYFEQRRSGSYKMNYEPQIGLNETNESQKEE